MAQQAIYFEILLLRLTQPFWWDPSIYILMLMHFAFVKDPDVIHLKGAGLEYTPCHHHQ